MTATGRLAAGTETFETDLRRVDVLPGGRCSASRLAERLTRRHSPAGTEEEAARPGSQPRVRRLPPLGLPGEIHSVDSPASGEWPHEDFGDLVRSHAESIASAVRAQLGARLAGIRIQAQAERRSTCYSNDHGSRAVQHRDWSVLGVQLLLASSSVRRWALTVHEDFTGRDHDDLAIRTAVRAEDLTAQLGVRAAAGRYELGLDADAAAVFWHEAVGHALEADFGSRSALHAGDHVMADGWLVSDDPVHPDGAGSYVVDDEGIAGRTTTLITGGKVVSLITDRLTAARLGGASTGNGRYGTGQIRPRMANITISGPGPAEVGRRFPRLILSRPIAGGYDGQEFVLRCWSSHVDGAAGDNLRPGGPLTLRGRPRDFLAGLRGCGWPAAWPRDGGLCNKGGSDGLHVGVNTPALMFGPADVDEAGDVGMTPP